MRPCPIKLKKTLLYYLAYDPTSIRYIIKKFDNAVKHNYNIDGVDAIKRNQYIKNVVLAQIQEGYKPYEITNAVKTYTYSKATADLIATNKSYFTR